MTSEAPAGTPLDEQQVARRGRHILTLLAIFSIINFGDKAVLGLAGPRIIDDLHLSNTQFGTIGSFFYLLFSLSALLVGLYGGKLPARWLLGLMALVWSAAQLPIVVPAAGFVTLVATRVLLGAGEGPGLPMANHVAFTWFPAARRTTAAGVITMGGALGVILGGPVLAATIAVAGWRWAFALLGVLGLLWTAMWARWGGDGPYSATAEVSAEAELVPIRRILVNPTWLAAVIAGFTGNWVLGLGLSWLPTFLEHRAGFSAATVGFLVGLPSLVAVATVPVVIYLAHRRRSAGATLHSTYAMLGFASAIVPSVALLCMTLGLPRPLLLVAVSVAFGAGIPLAPLTASAIADTIPVARRGVALCIGTAISSLGAVVSPWVTGRLLDLASTEAAGFDDAFRLASLLALLGGISLLVLNPERDAPRLHSEPGQSPGAATGNPTASATSSIRRS